MGLTETNSELRKNILEDIADRQIWATKQDEIARRRLSARRKQRKKPYLGAPNFVEPIIDDNVREKTDQEISMLLNAPVMAHAISLSGELSATERSNLEHAFDTYLRHIVEIRPILEEGLDTKNSRGFTVFKVVRSMNNRLNENLPIPMVVDPKDVIVPQDTKDTQSAERLVHVLRLSERGLRDLARKNQWDSEAVENIITKITAGGSGDTGSDEDSIHEVTSDLVGLGTSETEDRSDGGRKIKNLVIWEVYRYADKEDQERNEELIADHRMVSVFCPDVVESNLSEFPWREEDEIDEMEDELIRADEAMLALEEGRDPEFFVTTPGKDKPWPNVQSRYESRSSYWYDCRGIGELCMDNQIRATQMVNAKSVMTDYFGHPLYTGSTRNSGNISFKPGSKMPDNFQWVQSPTVPQQFDFDINADRAIASKRSGSSGQNLFSSAQSSNNAVEKTAREVQEESARVNMVSSASVDRFNSPMGNLFQLIWQDLQRLKPKLPIIANNALEGELSDSLFDKDILWIPASSAKTLNPELQLQRSMSIAQFAMSMMPAGLPVDAAGIWETVASYWDPRLTADWVIDPKKAGPEGQPPLLQQLTQMQQMIQQLGEGMSKMGESLQAGLKLAQENAGLNDEQAKDIDKNRELIGDLSENTKGQFKKINQTINDRFDVVLRKMDKSKEEKNVETP